MTDTPKGYQVNYHHKDRLFRFIFKEKRALLSLYNAINDSDYQDEGQYVWCGSGRKIMRSIYCTYD